MTARAHLTLWLWLALAGCAASPPAPSATPGPSAPASAEAEPEPARAVDEGAPIADAYPVPSAVPVSPEPPAPTPPPSPLVPRDAGVAAANAKAEAGKLGEAAAELTRALPRIDREAPLEDRMLAHALLGRRHGERRDSKKARAEYQLVLAAWSDPGKAAKTILGASPDEAQGLRRLGQALTVVGEALFFEAEQKRAKALALRPPRFAGAANDEAVRRYISREVAPWMQKRRTLGEEADAAYRKILDLQPVPPPRWVVAAASEVGTLYEALPKDLEKVAVPPSIRNDPKLLSAYQSALHDALAPELERAKGAYRLCKNLAEKYRHHDAYTKTCEARLTALESQSP